MTYPEYIPCAVADEWISENRAITFSASAIAWINTLIDESLFTILENCSTNEELKLPITTECIKQGLLTFLPNALGKNAILESELGFREYVKSHGREARLDPAFKRTNSANSLGTLATSAIEEHEDETRCAVQEAFEELRMAVQALPKGQGSRYKFVSPLLVNYTATILLFIAEYIVRGVGIVIEREPLLMKARTADLVSFLEEDEMIGDAYANMRTKQYIDRELQPVIKRKTSMRTPPARRRPSKKQGVASPKMSIDLPRKSSNSPYKLKKNGSIASSRYRNESIDGDFLDFGSLMGSMASESDEAFDQLLDSGKTLKLSLSPERLGNIEMAARSKSSIPVASPHRSLHVKSPKREKAGDSDDLIALFSSDPPWEAKQPLTSSKSSPNLAALNIPTSPVSKPPKSASLTNRFGHRLQPKDDPVRKKGTDSSDLIDFFANTAPPVSPARKPPAADNSTKKGLFRSLLSGRKSSVGILPSIEDEAAFRGIVSPTTPTPKSKLPVLGLHQSTNSSLDVKPSFGQNTSGHSSTSSLTAVPSYTAPWVKQPTTPVKPSKSPSRQSPDSKSSFPRVTVRPHTASPILTPNSSSDGSYPRPFGSQVPLRHSQIPTSPPASSDRSTAAGPREFTSRLIPDNTPPTSPISHVNKVKRVPTPKVTDDLLETPPPSQRPPIRTPRTSDQDSLYQSACSSATFASTQLSPPITLQPSRSSSSASGAASAPVPAKPIIPAVKEEIKVPDNLEGVMKAMGGLKTAAECQALLQGFMKQSTVKENVAAVKEDIVAKEVGLVFEWLLSGSCR